MSRSRLFEFPFPDLGEGLSEGKVLELKVKPGQRVRQGQSLAVVETDKVVADIPSPRDGTLVRFEVAEGETVQVGRILATLEVEKPEQTRAAQAPDSAPAAPAPVRPQPEPSLVGELESSSSSELPPSREGHAASKDAESAGRQVTASPIARKLAAQRGIDLAGVQGTGPGGRVLRKDVAAAATPRGPHASRVQPLSTLRRALAANMEKSNAIPSAMIHELVEVEELLRLRRELNEGRGEEGQEPRLGLLPFFVKFAALALREFPLLNAAYRPESQEVELFEEVNIGFAVDSGQALQVPVLRHADTLSLPRIQAEVDRLAAAARGRSLRLEELRGGTFTISNYGAFAGLYGRPLILPPQVGILGVGRIHDQPALRGGAWAAVPHLPLSLVFDHRVLDGVYAAGFLRRFMELAGRPQKLLLF